MLNIKNEVAGFFKIEAIRPDGTKKLLADWFPNLITDNGLDLMGTSEQYLTSCHVGTSNTVPNVTQTSLSGFVAATSIQQESTTENSTSSPYYASRVNTYRFSSGAAAGNLAEVGIAPLDTTGNLFSRALILDGDGNPTTITVLSDETLDITYELRIYPNIIDVIGSVTIDGTLHNYIARPFRVTDDSNWGIRSSTGSRASDSNLANVYSGALGDITARPSGSSSPGNGAVSSYIDGSLSQEITFNWLLNTGNFDTGITAIGLGMGWSSWQIGFDPAIPKDDTKTFSITASHSWARRT